jgi:DNA-binding MarR family transcriptional regulator
MRTIRESSGGVLRIGAPTYLPRHVTANESLGPTLHALARAHRTYIASLLGPHGLHAGQDLLLLALWESPGMRQRALADQLGVEPPTVTRMLQRLERAGMVERRADSGDGRVTRVFPTPRSRLLEGAVRRAWNQIDERLIQALGSADALKLERLARTAAAALERARGDEPDRNV